MDTNETTRPVCSCCGATIETDDYYTFNGSIDNTGAMERGMFDTTNLMMYDYRYFRRNWWNVPESCESEPHDVRQLKDFASSIGVSREDIDLLLSYGYFVEEIEEMLYQPGVIEEALCEILNECAYDYCGEF